MQLNGLLSSKSVHRMLEKKDCPSFDMMFPFVSAFLNNAPRYAKDGELTKVNSLYSELLVEIYGIMRYVGVVEETIMN